MTNVKYADYVAWPTWRGRVVDLPRSCYIGWSVWYDDGEWCQYATEVDARSSAQYWKGNSTIFHNGRMVA